MAMKLLRFGTLAAVFSLVALLGLRSTRLITLWKKDEPGRSLATQSWLDPKTVQLKNVGQGTNLASMRIAAFGISKTWGAGLIDPNDVSWFIFRNRLCFGYLFVRVIVKTLIPVVH